VEAVMKSERELVAKYHDIHETVDKMGKALLELMRHPDATAEQLDEGRLKYFVTYNTWVQARMELRKLYPAKPLNPFQRELPWNQKV
jgi:hypothetical protein